MGRAAAKRKDSRGAAYAQVSQFNYRNKTGHKMTDGHDLYQELRQFTGGDQPYRHALVKSFNYTEGVRHFARNAGGGAYWFLDILATEPRIAKHVQEMGFALVDLKVGGTHAVLTVANDSGEEPFFKKTVSFTDCPEAPVTEGNPNGSWKFYIEQTMIGDKVVPICLLPSER
jgi:hypothetical protein